MITQVSHNGAIWRIDSYDYLESQRDAKFVRTATIFTPFGRFEFYQQGYIGKDSLENSQCTARIYNGDLRAWTEAFVLRGCASKYDTATPELIWDAIIKTVMSARGGVERLNWITESIRPIEVPK